MIDWDVVCSPISHIVLDNMKSRKRSHTACSMYGSTIAHLPLRNLDLSDSILRAHSLSYTQSVELHLARIALRRIGS
jgi:hypothetical protein